MSSLQDPLHVFDPPLVPARLLRRYKRFLADVVLEEESGNEAETTVHCPNPGAMTGCADPGMRVWLAPVRNPKARLPYRWVLSETPEGVCIGVDTGRANLLVHRLLLRGLVPELADYDRITPEVRLYEKTRVDFLLEDTHSRQPPLMLEVKSVTLRRGLVLAFPDASTARGRRHLDDLARLAGAGLHRAAVFYLAQRADGDRVAIAADIDPAYAEAARRARAAGVRFLARRLRLTPRAIFDDGPLPYCGDQPYVEP
ncbi:MAG: DNA/RNA nuclease SfsA [Alphaproteobacteria bacterium]|nr:MAG: DNA/RNA nuclease SfsA [Alphaproteobacteria bacterium]